MINSLWETSSSKPRPSINVPRQTTVRKLANVGIELLQQSTESGNVFGTSSMNDVEVLGRDGRAVNHCSSAAHHDELHPGIREAPKKLANVSVPWTWHLSRLGAKLRSASTLGISFASSDTTESYTACAVRANRAGGLRPRPTPHDRDWRPVSCASSEPCRGRNR